jgi:hypothetical protein
MIELRGIAVHENSDVVRQFIDRIDTLGIDYAIGGSFASSAWGNPRHTNDLDVVINLEAKNVRKLIDAFKDDFMLSENEIERSATSHEPYRSFQLLHFEQIFKIDVFLLNDTPFDQSGFSRRTKREYEGGFPAFYFTAEDTILRKLLWRLITPSDRQWNDVVQILEVRKDLIDKNYLQHWAKALGIEKEIEEAMVQAAKVDEQEN